VEYKRGLAYPLLGYGEYYDAAMSGAMLFSRAGTSKFIMHLFFQ